MNTPLVSVVVPVYKVEKYLDECVESILRQTYKAFELILVDDGSPDRCPQMCDAYAAKDRRVKVIHKANGGLSDARNVGSQTAQGEYITFVDSDDYVAENYLEYLVQLARTHDADISVGGRYSVTEEKQELPIATLRQPKEEVILSPKQAVEQMCYGKILGFSAWAKLYKKDIVLQNLFPKGKLFEDLDTVYKMADNANKVAIGTLKIYYCRQRLGSIRHSRISSKELYGLIAAENLIEYLRNKYPDLVEAGRYRYVKKCIEYMPVIIASDDEEQLKSMAKNVRKYLSSVLFNVNVPWKMKAATLITAMGGKASTYIWRKVI